MYVAQQSDAFAVMKPLHLRVGAKSGAFQTHVKAKRRIVRDEDLCSSTLGPRSDTLFVCRENDRRSQWPRYQKEAFQKNLALVESVKELADKKGCTPGQLALAWVHAQVSLVYGRCRLKYHTVSLHLCLSWTTLNESAPHKRRPGIHLAVPWLCWEMQC